MSYMTHTYTPSSLKKGARNLSICRHACLIAASGLFRDRFGAKTFQRWRDSIDFLHWPAFSDVKMLGLVCQLHYEGGGTLLYQSASGDWLQVPFVKAPYLRIGQTVFFSLNQHAGKDEAVDLQVSSDSVSTSSQGNFNLKHILKKDTQDPCPQVAASKSFGSDLRTPSSDSSHISHNEKEVKSSPQTMDLPNSERSLFKGKQLPGKQLGREVQWVPGSQALLEGQNEKIDKESSKQSRRLQYNISKFQNAELEERLLMIQEAEKLLSSLLSEADVDGDAMCKLVCRVAGWLHVPVFGNKRNMDAMENNDENGTFDSYTALQPRVRQLLISALSHLDLTDFITHQAVEMALMYMAQLLQKLDVGNSESALLKMTESTSAGREWQRLYDLIHARQSGLATSSDKFEKEQRKRAEMAISSNGVYHPSKKMKTLDSVFCSEQKVELSCSKCTETMTSTWFWRHPGTGKAHVLVPAHGHSACRKRFGKRVGWHAQGLPMCVDNFASLDFCEHKKPRQRCRDCGGLQFCVHNRRRDACQMCKDTAKMRKEEIGFVGCLI